MRKHLYLTVIAVLAGCQFIFSQSDDLKFNLVDDLNGLPVGKITSITQDSYGAMWFAGEGAKCLLKYDGSRFTTFRHDENDPHSIGLTKPFMVEADSNGVVWVGASEGLDKYDPSTGHFTHYKYDPNNPSSLGSDVGALLNDSKGRLWIGAHEGLYLMNKKTGEFTHFKSEPGNSKSLSDNFIGSLYEDHQGTIWVGTGNPFFNAEPGKGGLNRVEPDGTFTQFLSNPANPSSLISNKINSIFEDSNGIFWVGTMEGGLHVMDRSSGTFKRYMFDPKNPNKLSRPPHSPENDALRFIIEDSEGQIWMAGMSGGINRYNPKTDKITNFNRSHGFPDQSGWNAFISADQSLWITTEQAHLYHVTTDRLKMKGFFNDKNAFGFDNHSGIRSFMEDKSGTIWVGTSDGLWEYDKEMRLIERHLSDPKHSTDFNGNVTRLYQDQPDSLWIGSGNGTFILDLKKREFSKLQLPEPFDQISFSFYRDKTGKMWIGTISGLASYDLKTGHVDTYKNDPNDSTTIGFRGVMSIVEDKTGSLWASTWGGGINLLDKSTGKFKHYLPQSIAYCIYLDSESVFWAGTSNGLFRYDRDKDMFATFFDKQSGLELAQVGTMVEDDHNNLWTVMAPGLLKINKERNETSLYWESYGDIPFNTNQSAIYHASDDRIFVGGEHDFNVFHPSDLPTPYQFRIIVNNLMVNNVKVTSASAGILSTPIEAAQDIVLRYNENTFAFSVGSDDYRLPNSIRYFARLKGYDDWRDLSDTRNLAYYYNVPPGEYTLRLRAYNLEGTRSERSITVLILPPWWKTWWAYSFYGIALIGLGLGGFRVQRGRIIAHERQKTQATELAQAKEIEKAYHQLRATQAQLIQSEKMASLGELTAGIAHEIQNPLNFVNNFSELNGELADELTAAADSGNIEEVKAVAMGIKENAEKITHHGKRADAIVKGMLQHSRTSTGTKEPSDINALCDEYLRLSYHGLRAKDKSFNATMNTDFDQNLGLVKIIPQDIGRVILNLLTNAFYAATEKKKMAGNEFEPTIFVSTRKIANMIEIRVKDNGNGIPKQAADKIFQPFFTTKPSGQGTGLGLSLSYDIVKAHGGEIKVNSKEGEGTEFIVSIPFS